MKTTALTAGAAALSTSMKSASLFAAETEQPYATKLHSAAIVGEIRADEIENLAKLGYEGVETTLWDIDPDKAIE